MMHTRHKTKKQQGDSYPQNQDIGYHSGAGRAEQLRRPTQGVTLARTMFFSYHGAC